MAFGIMIFIFSCLVMFGGALAIYSPIRNSKPWWPGLVGVLFAVGLLVATFVGIATKWGDCGSTSATAEGAVVCVVGECLSGCNPDVWKVDCRKQGVCPAPTPTEASKCAQPTPTPVSSTSPKPTPTPLAQNSYCPKGQKAAYDYCEPITPNSAVKQKWATWSDLSFVAAVLCVFWLFQYFDSIRDRGRGWFSKWLVPTSADNPMVYLGPLSVIYGLIVIFMGPPSMWYHASMKEWAAWFDAMSVVIWLSFNAVYVWYTICGPMWGRGRGMAKYLTVICIWDSMIVMFGIIGAKFPHQRLYFYFISGGLWGLGELIYLLMSNVALGVQFRRNGWIFFTNLLLLGLTMTIWVLFNRNIASYPKCIAREAFPGHALFHILASISTVVTWLSFASENDESQTSRVGVDVIKTHVG